MSYCNVEASCNGIRYYENLIRLDDSFQAIVDTVSTTIPWAWDEIRAAFNDIVEAFKNIVKGPKTAVQNIGKGAARLVFYCIAVHRFLDLHS